jgi:hypothetical protein
MESGAFAAPKTNFQARIMADVSVRLSAEVAWKVPPVRNREMLRTIACNVFR